MEVDTNQPQPKPIEGVVVALKGIQDSIFEIKQELLIMKSILKNMEIKDKNTISPKWWIY